MAVGLAYMGTTATQDTKRSLWKGSGALWRTTMTAVYAQPAAFAPQAAQSNADAQNQALAKLSSASLVAVLALSALFVLLAPGQPLAAMMGIQSCGMAG